MSADCSVARRPRRGGYQALNITVSHTMRLLLMTLKVTNIKFGNIVHFAFHEVSTTTLPSHTVRQYRTIQVLIYSVDMKLQKAALCLIFCV